MSLHSGRYSATSDVILAEGWNLQRLTQPSRLFGANGIRTGADGRIDFDPGLSRGTGGSAPGLLAATLGDDYGFLNLGQPAFDLTDRGVSGRVNQHSKSFLFLFFKKEILPSRFCQKPELP